MDNDIFSLPSQERDAEMMAGMLAGIALQLRRGETPKGAYLLRAVCSLGRCHMALSRYPHSPIIEGYATQAEKWYAQIERAARERRPDWFRAEPEDLSQTFYTEGNRITIFDSDGKSHVIDL